MGIPQPMPDTGVFANYLPISAKNLLPRAALRAFHDLDPDEAVMADKLRLKCLIVEDDEDYVKLIRATLDEIPHLQCTAHWEPDFDTALSCLRDKCYAICFVDYYLGERNGLEFIKAAGQADIAVPMVLLTYADAEVDIEASGAGATDFLPKNDLSWVTLSRTIRFAVANAKKNAALRERQGELAEVMNELSEQRALLQLALEHTKHGIALFGADKCLITCNARYLQIYGFDPGIVRPGISVKDILSYSISLGNYANQEVERALSERELQISLSKSSTHEQRISDGRTISLHHEVIEGGLSVTTCEDITASLASKQRSAELAHEAALAGAEVRAKTRFLSNMSHELRTPLNAIIGFSDVMRQELFGSLGSKQYKGYAQDTFDSAMSLLEIIDQILDMSHLFADELGLDEEIFLLSDIISATTEKYQHAVEHKRLTLRFSPKDEPMRLRGDSAKIEQAVTNIVDNAVKFSLPGGIITISTEHDEQGAAVVTVSDTGSGIREDYIRSVLNPFEQEESAEARRQHGTGLGLPIALGLIRLHGGDVQIESGVGRGTTVRVTIPAARVVKHSGRYNAPAAA